MDIDRIFGITYQLVSKLISLYGPFNRTSGVIFPVSNENNNLLVNNIINNKLPYFFA